MNEYTTSIHINAPAELVWKALTSSQYTKQYIGVDVISTWEVGSPVVYRNYWEGETHDDKGSLLESEPYTKLVIAYLPILSELPDEPGNYQVITCTLDEKDGSTHLTINHANINDTFFGRRAPELWGDILRGLKAVVEAEHTAAATPA